jgi:hypothetical protein
MNAARQREAISAPQLFLDTAQAAAAAWAEPLYPDAAARAAGQLRAAVRWLYAAVAILAAADGYPVLDSCQRHLQAAWRCTAALNAPECGQGDGSSHGDLLCAAARYTAGTWSQRRPGQGHRDADLAALAFITDALARAALALACQQPGTPAAASLSAAAGCLDTASGLLPAAVSQAPRPAAGPRRRPRTGGRQQAGPEPARQPDS